MSSAKVRSANISRLGSLGFKVAPSLPVRSGLAGLRPQSEIVRRLLALEVLFSWVARPDVIVEESVVEQLKDWLTEDEREVIGLPRPQANAQFVNTIGWKLENIWPLAWVLGFDKTPDVDGEVIDPDTQNLILNDFLPAFESKFNLRPEAQVAELEDLFYCTHNAVRSAQLGGTTVPDGFHPVYNGGVIHERRHALTWSLSRGSNWEDTDLST